MSKPMVLVAGATGYLGGHVVRELHRQGYPVRALARDPERLGDLRPLCHEVVVGQATQAETLEGLVGQASVVFSSLGKHDFNRKPTTEQVDYQANINILQRAREAEVEHFVFISVINGERLAAQGVAGAAARERVVSALQQQGPDWTVLRPTGFFNDMADMFKMAQKGTGWLIDDGAFEMNPIHGADLAAEVVRSISDPAQRNTARDVGGPDVLTYRQIMELAFAALDKPPRLRSAPAWTLRAAAPLVGPFNPMVRDILKSIYWMSRWHARAPCCGTHHLEDFYRELAAAD